MSEVRRSGCCPKERLRGPEGGVEKNRGGTAEPPERGKIRKDDEKHQVAVAIRSSAVPCHGESNAEIAEIEGRRR